MGSVSLGMINYLLPLNPIHLSFSKSFWSSIIKPHQLTHHLIFHLMNKMPLMNHVFLIELVVEMLIFLVLVIHQNFLILPYFAELKAFNEHFE